MKEIDQCYKNEMEHMRIMINSLSLWYSAMQSQVSGGTPLFNGIWGPIATMLGNQENTTRSSQVLFQVLLFSNICFQILDFCCCYWEVKINLEYSMT